MDKLKLKDKMGRPLTQGLFLEIGYGDLAVYTLKDEDYEYRGKDYPSLKRLYLECEDPTEYEFATKHLLGWKHWQRLCANKALTKYIDEWREELELKLRSQAVRDMIDMTAKEGGNYQASKWLADRGWEKRGAGRPTKEQQIKEDRIQDAISNEYAADVERLRLN